MIYITGDTHAVLDWGKINTKSFPEQREMPSDEEYEEALSNLAKYDFDVDVVLTHCAPEEYIGENMPPVYNHDINRLLAGKIEGIPAESGNRLTKFLDSLIIDHGLKYKKWYFGHYHRDLDWERFSLVYNNIRILIP